MSWSSDLEQLIRSRWTAGDQFSLAQVYAFIPELERLHPGAQNVNARVRDALQSLRQHKCVEFVAKGTYRLR